MVILLQDWLFIFHRNKKKFVPCWAILAHDLHVGPTLALYEDNLAKQQIGEKIPLASMAPNIRFGSTAWPYLNGPLDLAQLSNGKDPRVDKHLLIGLMNRPERRPSEGKKMRITAGTVWLCCLSIGQFFEIIKALSNSLISMGLPAPARSRVESTESLHNYKPCPFVPSNEWENFWDNPGQLEVPKEQIFWTGSTISLGRSTDTLHQHFESISRTTKSASTNHSIFTPIINKNKNDPKNWKKPTIDTTVVTVLYRVSELPDVKLDNVLYKRPMEEYYRSIKQMEKQKKKRGENLPTEFAQIVTMDEVTAPMATKNMAENVIENNQNPNPITVIQLLDDAIEEGDHGQYFVKSTPAPPPPTALPQNSMNFNFEQQKKYANAEVQTEQTMATSGFWPLLVAADEEHQTIVAKGMGKRRASNGEILNSSSRHASTNSDYDPELAAIATQKPEIGVLNMEEIGTRFYRVELAESMDQTRKISMGAENEHAEEESTQF